MGDGKKLSGQQFDPRGDTTVRKYTEQVMDYNKGVSPQVVGVEGTDGVEITPMDGAAAKVRTWDLIAIRAELAATYVNVAGKTTVDLPDVLTALVSTYNKTLGVGAGSHPSSQQGFVATGNNGSGSLNPHATAQASAAILPDLSLSITTYRNLLVPCKHVFFYSALPVTTADVLARLTTILGAAVLDIPVFKPKIYSFTLKGMQVSIKQSADTRVSASFSESGTNKSSSYDYGSDKSGEIGVSIKTITTPPVINGALSITGDGATDSQAVSVSVDASAMAITGTVAVGALPNTPAGHSATASASIVPSSITATSPAAVPTTGLYLVGLNPDIGEFGYAQIHAIVVDFSVYA